MNGSLNQEVVENEIDGIEHRLLSSSIDYGEGVGWVGLQPGEPTAVDVSKGLYQGQLGIALFFAGHYKVTGDAQSRQITRQVVDPFFECGVEQLEFEYIGGMEGIGSYLYTLSKIIAWLDVPEYHDCLFRSLERIDERTIQADRTLDVVHGSAGLLLSLLSLPVKYRNERWERLVRVIGDHLVAESVDVDGGGVAWETEKEYPTAGFAHGAAGITYALFKLSNIVGEDEYAKIAKKGVTFENRLYDSSEQNWASGTESESYWTNWCWGAPGIALARLASSRFHPSQRLTEDVARGLDRIDGLKPEDNLCHGSFGHISTLLSAAETVEDTHQAHAKRLYREALDRCENRGYYSLPNQQHASFARPSFFLGLAGIGYTSLRLLAPNKLPSVLLLE